MPQRTFFFIVLPRTQQLHAAASPFLTAEVMNEPFESWLSRGPRVSDPLDGNRLSIDSSPIPFPTTQAMRRPYRAITTSSPLNK